MPPEHPLSSFPSLSGRELDEHVRAAIARSTLSLSPTSMAMALQDWGRHLAASPGKQLELASLGLTQAERLAGYLRDCLIAGPGAARACVEPPARDRRFAEDEWKQWPFNLFHQSFLLGEEWLNQATHGVLGVERHHENLVSFFARQLLDMASPGNQFVTNPVVQHRTLEEGGRNLLRGWLNSIDDFERASTGTSAAGTEAFEVGRNVGITPGKVVLKNRVVELIQYTPTTPTVHPEPVMIVPAWIMKYYILDLSQTNSLVRFLVDHGHTVFCLSWKNPGSAEADLGMDDYLELGFHACLAAINALVPRQKVHAVGYCIGGTLLSIAAAAMARDDDDRLASATLLAAQTDFSEPGELALFIDESQVAMLEAQMTETGYLTATQMAGAFQMLRSYDLLWSRLVNDYLLGDRRPMNDLMAWNADTTRMPATMHSQYLRRLFLNDDLSGGRYPVQGRPVSLSDLGIPLFMVGTITDHVAPWRSVHKLHHLTTTEVTFVLTSGGHNAGIVNPPGNPRRRYQMLERPAGGNYIAPDAWQASAPQFEGSWWPAWQRWLADRSGTPVKPPRTGNKTFPALADAPGSYVLEK